MSKAIKKILYYLLISCLILILIPNIEATSTCVISATICKGQSYIDTGTGGLLGAIRCFFLDTDSVLGNHICSSTQDRITWEMDAGNCITLNYFDVTQGATPPLTPNKVTIQIRFDTSATNIITFLNQETEPANGATFSFCATNDGLITGSPRAGTYRIYLQVIKDNGLAGQNYNLDSDGVETVGSNEQFAQGALRSNILVSSLIASAPPSGTNFAYGSSGNELVTLTSTRTQKNGGTTTETITFNTRLTSGGSIIETSTVTESSAAATDSTQFIIDNTYQASLTNYDIEYNIISNAALTNLPWSTFPSSGHGASVIFISSIKVRNENEFSADPRIIIDKNGIGGFAGADNLVVTKIGSSSGIEATLFNKGEITYFEGYIYNSRDELLSRSMTFVSQDSIPIECNSFGSLIPVSNKYSAVWTIPTSSICLAANDIIGSSRTIRITNTDQSHTSDNSYFISSLYHVDYHSQKMIPLIKDDFPLQDSTEDKNYIISSDVMKIWCHIEGVRLDNTEIDTGISDIVIEETELDDTTIIDTVTTGTASDGWTTPEITVNPNAPARSINGHCDVTFNGNTGTDTETIGWVSAFSADKICRISALPSQPIIVNETVRIYIHTEKNQNPIIPDLVPQFTSSMVDRSIMPEVWTDEITLADTNNVVDDTQTVNGALYYYDWTPTSTMTDSILVVCRIEGATIQSSSNIAITTGLFIGDFIIDGNLTVTGNTTILQNIFGGMMNVIFEFEIYTLMLIAVGFFAIIAEWKRDALFWFVNTILSIYLLIIRPDDSNIPIPIFIGWIFVTLYQAISILTGRKSQDMRE